MAREEEILLYQKTENMQNYLEEDFQEERIKKFESLIKDKDFYEGNKNVISIFLEYLKSSREFISHYQFN